MVSLGEIAVQAGVRPPLASRHSTEAPAGSGLIHQEHIHNHNSEPLAQDHARIVEKPPSSGSVPARQRSLSSERTTTPGLGAATSPSTVAASIAERRQSATYESARVPSGTTVQPATINHDSSNSLSHSLGHGGYKDPAASKARSERPTSAPPEAIVYGQQVYGNAEVAYYSTQDNPIAVYSISGIPPDQTGRDPATDESESITPEHLQQHHHHAMAQPQRYHQSPHQQHYVQLHPNALALHQHDPMSPSHPHAAVRSPSSRGPYSPSSPSSFHQQQQHPHQQQHQVYSYHAPYFAQQFPYHQSAEAQHAYYSTPGQSSGASSQSPVLQPVQPGMVNPNYYPGPVYYSTPAGPVLASSTGRDAAEIAGQSQHQIPSPDDTVNPSASGRPFTAQDLQKHQAQHAGIPYLDGVHFSPYASHQRGLPAYLTFPNQQVPGSPFTAYDYASLSSGSSLSPIMTGGYTLSPAGHRAPLDYSATVGRAQSPYQGIPFPLPQQPQSFSAASPIYGTVNLPSYPGSATDSPTMAHFMNVSQAAALQQQQQQKQQQQQQQAHQQFQQHLQQQRSLPHMIIPQSPYAPTELARGHLAQAKLRDAVGVLDPTTRLPLSPRETRRQSSFGDNKLPRPPAHSPWALWVGNVPADATHTELWRFFTMRPAPGPPAPGSDEEKDALEAEALFAEPSQPKPDYNSVGIESIHLISRSNCCFVNMASKRHLDHAIKVCNGLSLRPGDPRCKPLVCRVRKKEDDNKTGVGAQRGKGMHRAWVAEQEALRKGAESGVVAVGDAINTTTAGATATDSAEVKDDHTRAGSGPHPHHKTSTSTSHSGSTSSTTSSLLTKAFPKRYFILKSHTEEDLHLSVERGLWATQSHNEPVLDQAFRTSTSVYLIFGANKSGEFFGYATMSGPILKGDRRMSWKARNEGLEGSGSSGSSGQKSNGSVRRQEPPIPEDNEEGAALADLPLTEEPSILSTPSSKATLGVSPFQSAVPMLSPSGSHVVASSPGTLEAPIPVTAVGPDHTLHHAANRYTEPPYFTVKKAEEETEKKSETLDPVILAKMHRMNVNALSGSSVVANQLAMGSSGVPPHEDNGILTKDTALFPEERNARLELLEKEKEDDSNESAKQIKIPSLQDAVEQGWGRPFKVTWNRVQKLPFHRTRHLRNAFNGNREVKISRDGTEVEPTVGAQLLELFWKDLNVNSSPTTTSPAVPQTTNPPNPSIELQAH